MDTQLDIWREKKARCPGTERIKWWRLKGCKTELEADLRNLVTNLNQNQSASNIYLQTVDQICNHYRKVIGTTKPGRKFIDKQVWW